MAQYNTLKKRRFIKALETSSTLREAATKAGYSTKSPGPYEKPMKAYIDMHMHSDPEKIKQRFEHLSKKAEEKQDFTNALRGTEALARCGGLFIDRSEVKTFLNISVEDRITRLKSIMSTSSKLQSIPQQVVPGADKEEDLQQVVPDEKTTQDVP